ncbi:MAG TPA: hypothetical protein VMW17_04030 [Candidatus Binatia bacterium]|nr:hypothetical protein [Candidatus Binatia bacterium]
MTGRLVRVVLLIGALLAANHRAHGQALDQRIPGLFGGQLGTTIQPGVSEPQPLHFADQFRSLSAALAAARSQAPIPSASGAFRFAWDPDLDTFVRLPQSLGPSLAERAQTLGRHVGTLSVSYTRIDFDTLEGNSLNHLVFSQSAISQSLLNSLPPGDREQYKNDRLNTTLKLSLGFDLLFFTAAYGVTDDIDVSLALSVNRARMNATATAVITPSGFSHAAFVTNSAGKLDAASGQLCSNAPYQCAVDSFDDSATGTGDLFLRGKWHLLDTRYADVAAAGVLTVPTGNADDFLGFHDVTFTPWLIASKTFGRVSPHLNLGYAFRSGKDVSQAQWIAGTDLLVVKRLTLTADFLGFHDDKRDGVNDDVLQSAVGFKVNPIGQFVLSGNFQFPLNRDGLRADVIYTGQIEWTF